QSYEIRIPADQGIAGHVATTGKILNIKDAYSHPLFYRGVDDSTGFRTRNILCFPIKNESQEVIGVAELVNKINGPWFSKFDEDLATAFSIYCGISIAH
ncbi:cGMP-dependent 3',5'-cyclic phosphodiesterase, partial [Anas platyrhynchos]